MATATKKQTRGKKADAGPAKATPIEPLQLPADPHQPSAEDTEVISIDQIQLGDNIRSVVDPDSVRDLARSMAAQGQLDPIGVCPSIGTDKGPWLLVYGHRRLAAAKLIGWTSITAKCFGSMNHDMVRDLQLIENSHRENLTPIEEIRVVRDMLNAASEALREDQSQWLSITPGIQNPDFSFLRAAAKDRVIEDVANRLCKPIGWVKERAFIARLTYFGQRQMLAGRLPISHAREIAKVMDGDVQDQLVEAIARDPSDAQMSIEEVRRLCGQHLFSLTQVGWKLDVAFAGRGACVDCPCNTANTPGLFGEKGRFSRGAGKVEWQDLAEPKAGVCTDPVCFRAKTKAVQSALSSGSAKVIKRMEANGVKKADQPKVQKAAIAEVTPEYIRPAVLSSRVEQRLKRAKSDDGRPGKAAKPKETKSQQRLAAETTANSKLNEALRKRCKGIEAKLAPKMKSTPGLWITWNLITATKLYQATQHWNEKKAKAAAESPGLARLLAFLKTPSWEGLLEIEKECGRQYGLLDEYNDGKSGMADKFAAALGIELDPAPTLDDFLPAEFKSTPAKVPAAAKPAKASKKGGTAKRERPAVDDGDDDFGDEA